MSDFIEEKYFQKMNDINYEMLCEVDRVCKKHNIKYYLAYGTLIGAVRDKNMIPWDDDVDLHITPAQLRKLLKYKDEFSSEYKIVMPEDYGENVYFDSVVRLNRLNTRICPADDKDKYYSGLRSNISLDFFYVLPVPGGIRGKIYGLYMCMLYGMANAFRFNEILEHYGTVYRILAKILKPIGKIIGIKRLRKLINKGLFRYEGKNYKDVHINNCEMRDMMLHFRRSDFKHSTTVMIRDHEFPAPAGYDRILSEYYGDYMSPPPEEGRRWHLADPENFSYEE